MAEEETKTEVAPEKKKKVITVSYLAVVKMFAEPDSVGKLEIITAKSKAEMFTKLADPLIETVHYVMKGRLLSFSEARKVTF